MKIVCVGGGPAGLYFATLAKRHDSDHDITVVERNPPGVTYGWGVVYWDDLLDSLYRHDRVSVRTIRDSSVSWGDQEVRVGHRTAHLGGYGYSIGRNRLLDVLAARATDLGVGIEYEREIDDLPEVADADLVVACDGAGSVVRRRAGNGFGTAVGQGRNKYIWLGTHQAFDAFTFGFEQTGAGWIWFHAYRFDAQTSTFIVECSPQTWEGLGFEGLGSDESSRLLERIFARHLDGHALLNREPGRTPWLNFKHVSNETWHHDNVVLLGDAAHTTHFAIGSGTKLALEDAIGLAAALREHDRLPDALAGYERERRAALSPLQTEARRSSEWFEHVDHHIQQDPVQFAYSLWRRRGDSPLWRYQLHLATQVPAVRRLRSWYSSARRSLRAGRR